MKILVSYVVQDENAHRHESEVFETFSPPYTFSPEPPMTEVMRWVGNKQSHLLHGEKIILTSAYKVDI